MLLVLVMITGHDATTTFPLTGGGPVVAAGATVVTQAAGTRAISDVTWPGIPQAAGCARRHVRAVLSGHPSLDTALLLVSELVTNAVRHSRSADAGGRVGLEISRRHCVVRIEVIDDGPVDGMPHLVDAGLDAVGGRGLWIVQHEARWGIENRNGRTGIWIELAPCPGWCGPADDAPVALLAEQLRASGITIRYAGPNLLAVAYGGHAAWLALWPGEPATWQWLQRSGGPAVTLCPAADVGRAATCITRALAAP